MEDVKKQIAELEAETRRPDFWGDKIKAQAALKKLKELKGELAGGAKYEEGNAVVAILSGAGGIDAEDFSRMLFQMYQKFCQRRGFVPALLHRNENEHGGYRNLTFLVRGRGAYGILKGESGVHRLVRISPFSAKKLRHTSFSLVEVTPELKSEKVKIRPEEMKVDFARSSGPGGQNVNKRETAVRITHLPTGITVHSEAERSQERNREQALAILRGKLYKLKEEESQAELSGLKLSKTTDIEWGNQIRSYVLHPYHLVKDNRLGRETSRVEAVLDGELEIFLEK